MDETSESMDIMPIMTPERIVGALIWNVAHGALTNDLIHLADTMPREYIKTLEGDLDNLVLMTQGSNMAEEVRPHLIALLKDEIRSTLKMIQDATAKEEL